MANFFSTPKPKAFKITPRYWDPEKEQRELRERRIKAEMGMSDREGENYVPYISKGAFRRGMPKGRWRVKVQQKKSNIRLLIIVIILGILIYFLLK